MLIAENLMVESDQGTIKDASGCHDHLIGWVVMESAWELYRFDGDSWCEFEQPHTRVSQRLVEPVADRYR